MKRLVGVGAMLLLVAPAIFADSYDQMDYGPFISSTYVLNAPKDNYAHRGVAIKFLALLDGEKAPEYKAPEKGKKPQPIQHPAICGVIFDTETLRYAGMWSGGFITWNSVVFNGDHGSNPRPVGAQITGVKPGPGWAKAGDFKDPRAIPHEPIPRDWAAYKGLYRHGNDVVFSYTVGKAAILDHPTVVVVGKTRVFRRDLNITGIDAPLETVLTDFDASVKVAIDGASATLDKGGDITKVQVTGAKGATLAVVDKTRLVLKLADNGPTAKLQIAIWKQSPDSANVGETVAKSEPADLAPLTKGGKSIWNTPSITKGTIGDNKSAYTMDTIGVPFDNATKSWMRFGGLDFFKDGRAAISTWSGDVWIVSGLDDKLDKVTWKRYAAGLFHALGLKIVDDVVYVLGRDQITRLHDFNKDGEADFYECFNNQAMITQNFHEFTFDLHTDPEGNFYFIKGGPVRPGGRGWDKLTPHHGCVFKVSKDGSKLEVVARGFRAPNGMSVGPKGEITSGDNEGTWTPTCPINWIKPGGFYGVPDFAVSSDGKKPTVRDNPLCWLPHNGVDNSNGAQVWITGDKFGPLSNQLLHTSYGTCTLYAVLKEEVDGQMQGGVVSLPLKFDSGICRARFRSEDNALYLTGLRGWQTTATKDAGFYRVRYTGKAANLPIGLKVRPGEIDITFSDPLDKSLAVDADNYSAERWNYKWLENYGSPQFKVSNPKVQGHDEVEILGAKLSADGKTVTLSAKDISPVMQQKITFKLRGADGTAINRVIHHTINAVGTQRAELHPGELKVVEKK